MTNKRTGNSNGNDNGEVGWVVGLFIPTHVAVKRNMGHPFLFGRLEESDGKYNDNCDDRCAGTVK